MAGKTRTPEKPKRATKAPKVLCGNAHPDGDTTCTRTKDHAGKHSGPFGTGMSLTWKDGQAPRVPDDNCTATLNGRPCTKEAGHTGLHFGHDEHDNIVEWVDRASDQTKIETIVDGEAAEIVMDGKTGAPKQMDLIPKDPSEILGRLRKKHALLTEQMQELELRKSAYDEQKKVVDKTQKEHNQIVAELCDATQDGEKLAVAKPAPVDDEEEDEAPPQISDAALERIAKEAMGQEAGAASGTRVTDASGPE
jgi:hypothetical protein